MEQRLEDHQSDLLLGDISQKPKHSYDSTHQVRDLFVKNGQVKINMLSNVIPSLAKIDYKKTATWFQELKFLRIILHKINTSGMEFN